MAVLSVAVEAIWETAKVWGMLGSIAIAIAAGYWYEFRTQYAIPVPVGSSLAWGSLPVLFCLILFATLVLTVYVLAPSMAMWMKVDVEGRRLIDGTRSLKAKEFINPFRTENLSRAWLASQILVLGLMALCNWLMSGTDWASGIILLGTGVIACASSVSALRLVQRRAGIVGKARVYSNTLISYSTVLQCFVAVGLGRAIFGIAKDMDGVSAVECWMIWVVLCVAGIGAQYAFSHALRRRLVMEAIRLLPFLVLGLAALPLFVPPLAAKLATPAYRSTAGRGEKCVRLVASEKANKADWDMIATVSPVNVSDNLDLVVQMDGYHVKRHLNEDTVTIPPEQVRRITTCTRMSGKDDSGSG
ncbi:hypothetical protein [Luteibacter aegosomatissinici]|uniref:hypothetical protein n=1 Tax=Luteibacter aegosomatissinici TaxID=2911539 RepID=UPI001FFA04AD|nr:hypothetical protein [Luteibacter aegosomatissinici]UPG92689.1 hypothetical protein L2Y97_12515 [Luteibacter aegosomatissinici]